MHPNSLKNLKPYPPGVSGNAGKGRNRIPDELKGIKSLTQIEVIKLISKYARMTHAELMSQDKSKLSVLELAFISIFVKSIELGDFTRISFLLDRTVGKVPAVMEDDEDLEERQQLAKLSFNELMSFVKANLPEAG